MLCNLLYLYLRIWESINEPGIDETWKRIEFAQNTIDLYWHWRWEKIAAVLWAVPLGQRGCGHHYSIQGPWFGFCYQKLWTVRHFIIYNPLNNSWSRYYNWSGSRGSGKQMSCPTPDSQLSGRTGIQTTSDSWAASHGRRWGGGSLLCFKPP